MTTAAWSGVGRRGLPRPPLLAQHLVHSGDRDRPLANGRGHPFQASGPDIADCEDPGAARFEQIGSAGERPARGGIGQAVRAETMCTRRALWARNTAAWPAEF